MACQNCVLTLEQALTLFHSHNDTYNFLVEHEVIPASQNCAQCGGSAKLNIEKTFWGCQRVHEINGVKRRCSYRRSIVNGTWFESRLPIQQLSKLIIYYLTIGPPHQEFIEQQLNLSPHTVVTWIAKIREAMFHWCYTQQSQQIGGPGTTVEIDEAKFGHSKYERGRRIEGQWIFGGFERVTRQIFLEPVKDRKQTTLFEVIHRRIRPGTTIISDCWRAYNRLNQEGKHQQPFQYTSILTIKFTFLILFLPRVYAPLS